MQTRGSIVLSFLLIALSAAALEAQTVDDGLLMPSGALGTGFLYAHDTWTQYWEGSVKRDNGNIGTLTTQSVSWVRCDGPAQRHRHGAVRVDACNAGPPPRHARPAGHHAGGQVPITLHPAYGPRHAARHSGGRSRHPGQQLRARLSAALHRSGEPAVLGAVHAEFSSPPRVVPHRVYRLHVAHEGDARPAGVLHEWPALLERPGRHAGRVRVHRERGIPARPSVHSDLAIAATHPGRGRHPPPGHAVRLEPHEFCEA